jgi:hypothetical protein
VGNAVEVVKLDSGRFAKDCPECGKQQTYSRKWYADASLREGKICITCSNRVTEKCRRGMHRGIRISWFNKFQSNANLRGIPFSITIDDVADMMEEQGGQCALTGWCIDAPETSTLSEIDTSIDRIDSAFGYMRDNIQLVHKMVNMCKQRYSQDDFVDMCVAVASKVRQ